MVENSSAEASALIAKLGVHKKRLLQAAEVGFAQKHQFEAYRSILLDELGLSGFESELIEGLKEKAQDGTGRNIHAGTEVPK